MNPSDHRAGWLPDRPIRTVGLPVLAALFLALGALHAVADPGKGHGKGPAHHANDNGPPQHANGNGPSPKEPPPTSTPSTEPSQSSKTKPSSAPQLAPAPSPATAQGARDPRPGRPGNNGTVKVDAKPFDDAPDNEPHVGCRLEIDFYGYDQGSLDATYTLELKSPSPNGTLVRGSTFIGEDPPGGGTDLDASVQVDLQRELAASGAEPHPNQGFHVRLTVNAEGSIGADVKRKTFWTRCPIEAPRVTPPTPPASPPVMPSTLTPPPRLAITGSDPVRRAGMALLILLLGSGLLWLSRSTRGEFEG